MRSATNRQDAAPAPHIAAVDDDVVIGRMRQHQVGRLAHHVENALFKDVEARMQIEAVRLDAHLARHLDRRTADHRIGEHARFADARKSPGTHSPSS